MAAFVSYLLRFLDGISVIVFSFNLLKSAKIIVVNGLAPYSESIAIDNITSIIMNISVSLYILIRTHHFYHNSKLDRAHKREDLNAKKHQNKLNSKVCEENS